MIAIKRIYEPKETSDGYRVLVDCLWPRGVKKESATIDLWEKTLAPSPFLRKWFNHDPEKFNNFKYRYLLELKENKDIPEFLEKTRAYKTITLLYGAKDLEHNHALVLRDFLSSFSKA